MRVQDLHVSLTVYQPVFSPVCRASTEGPGRTLSVDTAAPWASGAPLGATGHWVRASGVLPGAIGHDRASGALLRVTGPWTQASGALPGVTRHWTWVSGALPGP